MELVPSNNDDTISQSFSMCGGTLYTGKDAIYFAMIQCNCTGSFFKVFDYVYVEDYNTKDIYVVKLHSIFIETKTNSLGVEAQYFPVLNELQAAGDADAEAQEVVVMELAQTLELKQIDLATVFIKPVRVMYLPDRLCGVEIADRRSYVLENISSYREHRLEQYAADQEPESDVEDRDEAGREYGGSFIASEGTPSVYSTSSEQIEDDSTATHSQSSMGTAKEFKAYFFYDKLDLNDGVDTEDMDLVPAVDPVLLDLLWSFTSDITDTTGEEYKTLVQYISKTYFNNVTMETLTLVNDERFKRLKQMVDAAIKDGDGSLVDPYEFFLILTS